MISLVVSFLNFILVIGVSSFSFIERVAAPQVEYADQQFGVLIGKVEREEQVIHSVRTGAWPSIMLTALKATQR